MTYILVMALSSNRSGHRPFTPAMVGSNPPSVTKERANVPVQQMCGCLTLRTLWGFSSAGRAIALQAIGQGFDSLKFHHAGDAKLPNEIGLNLNWKKPKMGRCNSLNTARVD